MLKCVKGKNEKNWSGTVVKFCSTISVFQDSIIGAYTTVTFLRFLKWNSSKFSRNYQIFRAVFK